MKRGLVASADTLSRTIFSPMDVPFPKDKNYVLSMGLPQVSSCNGICSKSGKEAFIHHRYFVGLKGLYTRGAVDTLNENILARFHKHPPMSLRGVLQNKDSVWFSYIFRQLVLPPNFLESNEGMKINGEKVHAIRCRPRSPFEPDTMLPEFYVSKDGKSYMLRIPFNGGKEEAVWIQSPESPDSWPSTRKMVSALMDREPHEFSKEEEILLPMLDFYISKIYDAKDFSGFAVGNYDRIQEDIKLKLTGEEISVSLEKRNFGGTRVVYAFDEGSIFYLRRAEAAKPYILVKTENAELLVKEY